MSLGAFIRWFCFFLGPAGAALLLIKDIVTYWFPDTTAWVAGFVQGWVDALIEYGSHTEIGFYLKSVKFDGYFAMVTQPIADINYYVPRFAEAVNVLLVAFSICVAIRILRWTLACIPLLNLG